MKPALVVISNQGREKHYLFKNRRKAFNFVVSRLKFLSGKHSLSERWTLSKEGYFRIYSNGPLIVKLGKLQFYRLRR